jgi:ATP-dependent helicase/DNAse subunit B
MEGHEIFTSSSLAALESALAEQVKEEKDRDPLASLVVMVGSHLLGRYLMRRLARELGGLVNARFITLRQMAETLGAASLMQAGLRRLPALVEDALLDFVIAQNRLDHFSALRGFEGLRSALKATLRDLRDADLLEALAGLEGTVAEQHPKWREIASLAASFYGAYGAKYYDGAALFQAAAESAPLFSSRFKTGRLLIYGLYDFTAAQARMIEELSRAASLKVFIPFAPDRSHEYAGRGLRWFTGLLGVKPTQLPHEPEQARVEIVAAPGPMREVEEIAGTIIRLAEQGMAFADMTVLLRHEQEYLPHVAEVFDRSSIPYYLASGPAATEPPLASCLNRLLDLIPLPGRREFFRPEVMEFLLSPLLRLHETGTWAADEWRDFSVAAGIVRGREEWDLKLKVLAGSGSEDRRKAVEDFRGRALRLMDLLEGFPREGAAEMSRYFVAMLRELLSDEALAGIAAELDTFADEASALDRLGVALDREGFMRVARSWLSFLDPGADAPRRFQEGAVTVGGIMAIRAVRARAVFAPGLAGRSFPAPVREDPILLDREREELAQALGKPGSLPLKGRRPSEDRLLFALLREAAEERLVLTYSRTDEQGTRERLPSPLLLELASEIQGRPVNYTMMAGKEGGVRRVPLSRLRSVIHDSGAVEDRPALDEAELLLWESARQGHALLPGAFSAHPFLKQGLTAVKERKKPFTGPFLGRIGAGDALPELERRVKEKKFSAGQLENYAQCPFSYFCGRIMEIASPVKPEDVSFDAASRGGLVHEALKNFMEKAAAQKLLPLRDAPRSKLMALMRECLDEACAVWEKDNPAAGAREWELDRERLLVELPSLLDSLLGAEEEEFTPVAFELAFGMGDRKERGQKYHHPDPVPLKLPDGEVIRLCGRIDRLDENKGAKRAVRSLDYKTGRYPFKKEEDLRAGTSLQAGLYLIAAGRIADAEVDDFCQSGYVYVMGDSAGRRKLCQGTTDFQERVLAAAGTIVAGIKAGIFSPLPASVEKERCQNYCDYREICGAAGAALLDRVSEQDPARRLRDELDKFK